ncbi:MAG: protease HtpX [Magnetococcales bacterium]|nr:protease HtpX [Magnetococcales bacterium]
MKRVFLFLLTNLAILLVLGIAMNIIFSYFGISKSGIGGLLVIAAVFGMGGSFISLAMSKTMVKWSTGAQVIKQPRNSTETWLIRTVHSQAERVGIGMPEIAVYDSPDMNAFATGMNRNNALVAVSTGLMDQMDKNEVEAVLAHEVSHVANGDMVTLSLIQGVVNTFVIVLARVIGGVVDSMLSSRRDSDEGSSGGGGFYYYVIVFILEMVFGVLASIIVMWFSRHREFHADRGGAKLAGRRKMIAALERLRSDRFDVQLPQEVATFGVSGRKSWSNIFMTHPPIEERIAVLRSKK